MILILASGTRMGGDFSSEAALFRKISSQAWILDGDENDITLSG